MSELVDDVQPAPGSLTRVLARSRRRRFVRRPLATGVTVAVAATVALLVVVVPSSDPSRPRAVGTAPDTYVTQVRDGVLARVDLGSGRRVGALARLPGRVTSLATDDERVYAAVAGQRHRLYELDEGGSARVVATAPAGASITDVTASGGRVAYVAGNTLVVIGDRGRRTVRTPGEAVDLALVGDGRLVLSTLGARTRRAGLYALPAGASTWSPLPHRQECAPLAIASTGSEVAALNRVDCGRARVRVTTFDPGTGRRVGAGRPFDLGADVQLGRVELSAGALDRYLVSVSGGRRLIVHGSRVRVAPGACPAHERCPGVPAAL